MVFEQGQGAEIKETTLKGNQTSWRTWLKNFREVRKKKASGGLLRVTPFWGLDSPNKGCFVITFVFFLVTRLSSTCRPWWCWQRKMDCFVGILGILSKVLARPLWVGSFSSWMPHILKLNLDQAQLTCLTERVSFLCGQLEATGPISCLMDIHCI